MATGRISGRATNSWGMPRNNVLPAVRLNGPSKASSGSELGGYRRFLGRFERFSPPRAPPNLVVLRLAPIVACSRAQGGASTLGPPGTHCMPRRLK